MTGGDPRRSFMLDGYQESPYQKWVKEQGIPVIEGMSVDDLNTVGLAPWEMTGGNAAFIHLAGAEFTNNGYVGEIPPGAALKPCKHLYEEFIFVLSGSGAASVWIDPARKRSFEWQARSLFAIPLNASYQLFNTSGSEPARYYSVTTAPLMLDLLHNRRFIFDNDFVFDDRFPPDDDYFGSKGVAHPGRVWETNFVPDVANFQLQDWAERGGGGLNAFFEIADSTMCASVSEFGVGRYKKAHRHGPGAHIVLLCGRGYSLLWRDNHAPVRVDWQAGSVFAPPDMWFHQHFNTGPEPARYMPLRWGSTKYHLFNYLGITKDVKEGGDQIEYEDEDPQIRGMFEAELAKAGIASRMPPLART